MQACYETANPIKQESQGLNQQLFSQPSAPSISLGGFTSAGKKAVNQDAFAAYSPSQAELAKLKGVVACIADGISNSKNAQTASQIACTGFIQDYFATPDYWSVKHSASKVLEAMNAWLHQQDCNSLGTKPGTTNDAHITTFSAVIIKSHTAYIFHVGDSRIYHLSQGNIEQLTTDHSYMHGSVRPHLVRGLGIESLIDIDYLAVPIKQGDRFLLTTDGVHDVLSHQELSLLASDTEQDLEQIAEHISKQALAKNSEDNISTLIINIDALAAQQVDDSYLQFKQLAIPPVLKVGDTIDDFTVIRLLANDARSHIYLAKSQLDQQRYILKMPAKDYQDDDEYLTGFALEQWIGARTNHPALMKIYPQPNQTQYLYHVCEYIEGMTLKQWLADRPCLSLIEARNMLKELVKPVRYMHRNNLIHRDLKPENFMINQDGAIKLIDYGTVQIASIEELSNSRHQESAVGDIGYIAPEILVYGKSSNRSDLFSLACIVYEMLSKQLPFTAILSNQDKPKRFDEWQYRPLQHALPAIIAPPFWVDHVLQKALSPNPQSRYATLSEFEADLRSPSTELLKNAKAIPLVEKHPVLFWKILTLALAIMLLGQSIYFIAFKS